MYDHGGFILPFAVLGGITSLVWLLSMIPIKQLQNEINRRVEDAPVPSSCPVPHTVLFQRVLFALNVFLYEFVLTGMFPTLPPFLAQTLGLSSTFQGLIITGNAVMFMIGAFLSMKVNRSIGARAASVIGIIAFALRPLLLSPIPDWVHSSFNSPFRLAMVILSVCVLSTFQAPWVVVQHPYLNDAFGVINDNTAADEKRMGYAAAVFVGMLGAGDTVGPILSQVIVNQWGFSTFCVASFALMSLWALVASSTFPKRVRASPKRGESTEDAAVPNEV